MEIYENFMNTAKFIWEEFTGSNQNTKNGGSKRDKGNVSAAQPPKPPTGKLVIL